MKKFILAFCLISATSYRLYSQTDNQILKYASRVKVFLLKDTRIEKGTFWTTVTNKAGQILRIKITQDGSLGMFYGSKTFVLYEFKNGYIQKITFFDRNGRKTNHTGEGFYHAVREFTILKPEVLKKKLKQIDEIERRLETPDEKEKIVLLNMYDTKGLLVHSEYLSSDEYWENQHMMYGD